MALAETSLKAALTAGPPIVMDGAMGTELTCRGSPIGADDWVASTLGLAADVAEIHRSYAEAGARLHIANSFATARHVLAEVGMEDRFEELNRQAVRLCRENVTLDCGPAPWIAGSLSTYVIGSDRSRLPSLPAFEANARDQAALLIDEGCDLFVLEMLHEVETSLALMRATAGFGKPVSIGFTCVFGEKGEVVLLDLARSGRPLPLGDALPAILSDAPADGDWIVTIMHSDLDVSDAALDVVAEHWSGPIGVYPNSGLYVFPDGWDFDSVSTPEDFVAHAETWAGKGARIIGGCCGVGPAHIAALSAARQHLRSDDGKQSPGR